MKGYRSPHRRRRDGKWKGLYALRLMWLDWGHANPRIPVPPCAPSALRTRSHRWHAGSRRMRRLRAIDRAQQRRYRR